MFTSLPPTNAAGRASACTAAGLSLKLPASRKLTCLLIGSLLLAPTVFPDAVFAEATSTDESSSGEEATDSTPTFVDQVTVAATLSERALKDTPATVDVIKGTEITDHGYTDVADLIRFTPGVYVDGDLTRLGSSGFNIRGIGGNRVLTQIDGIPTAEQFDFGPFAISQFSLDLENLETVEIVRSAGSAIYGSDALGGVVSLTTRSPRSFLGSESQYLGLRAGYDGRSDEISETVTFARGGDRAQASAVFSHRDGNELKNQGDIDTPNRSRTAPNPIESTQDNLLLKLSYFVTDSSQLNIAAEGFRSRVDTEVLSSLAPASPFSSAVLDFDADDRQDRQRFSVEHSLVAQRALADSVLWRGYWQQTDTEQFSDESREGSLGLSLREGLLSFEQQTLGFDTEAHKGFGSKDRHTITYGALLRRDRFDMMRDRTETLVSNGEPVPTSLIFPTKYFPESQVDELGAFVQAELDFLQGRLRVIPGARYDRFELTPEDDDTIFTDGNPGTSDPVGTEDDAISPKLGMVWAVTEDLSVFGQFSSGFRAPPMSSVNNGFTNQAGGYRTLPNPDLDPETSDNIELGVRGRFGRGSLSVTVFENRYEDFIETVFLGFNPVNFLVEFQPQNIEQAEISGIELSGDLSIGDAWRLRMAFATTEGENLTDEVPLQSIAPARFVTGLRYDHRGGISSGTWGGELVFTAVAKKDAGDLPADTTQFATPAYEVLDLAAWYQVSDQLRLQLSAWNLSDERYWQWAYVQGQSQDSPTIDRYSSPGRTFSLQARLSF